jgi:hypothetical protein
VLRMNRAQRGFERAGTRPRFVVALVLLAGTLVALVAGWGGRAEPGSKSINAGATVTTTAAGTVTAPTG